MLGLKVELKDAEKWKKYIVINNLMDKEYYYIKDKSYIYFPVKSKFTLIGKNTGSKGVSSKEAYSKDVSSKEISFVDKDFPKSMQKCSLKESLARALTKEELAFVKTAHDIIGSIAIVEIPKDLESREKIIAETLLHINSQVLTVLKKADIHEGVFRTQKMKYLAGINTKETVYKENNVSLKLDVEKVYFSMRLGNERKRIMQKILPGEEILVMFSGCAPYPVVLAKNTKAKHITGIEINPDGHRYGMENLRLNKIHNVLLINDDVHHAIPNIYQKIIGLKSSIVSKEMSNKMAYKPSIVEIHLFDDSLNDSKIKDLEKVIVDLKQNGQEVFIHAPLTLNGENYVLDNNDAVAMTKKLGDLCKKYFVSAVIHLANNKKITDEGLVLTTIKSLEHYYDYFYFENLIAAEEFNTKEQILRIARKAGFRNICIDLAHLYITYNDNEKIVSVIKSIQKEFNTYFHVADNDGVMHTCEIGKGFIDFNVILPLVNKGVIEVFSKDEFNPKEALNSYTALNNYSTQKYDRIIMPLPKTAGDFLDEALRVSKFGTIIHFYDFLAESQFDEAAKKIAKA